MGWSGDRFERYRWFSRTGGCRCLRLSGLTSGGLRFICSCFFFGRHPKTQGAHKPALYLVSGAGFVRNLHCFSSRIRSKGFRGPSWAPEGRKSTDKTEAGFIFSSFLKSTLAKFFDDCSRWVCRTDFEIQPAGRSDPKINQTRFNIG